jgi:hypothetical protein
MVSTDQFWGNCVDSIDEEFTLEQIPLGTRLTRTTSIAARGALRSLKEAIFYIGLKRVHLYVFKNWQNQTDKVGAPNNSPRCSFPESQP